MGVVRRSTPFDDEFCVRDGRNFALFATLANPVNPLITFPVDEVAKSVAVDKHQVAGLGPGEIGDLNFHFEVCNERDNE